MPFISDARIHLGKYQYRLTRIPCQDAQVHLESVSMIYYIQLFRFLKGVTYVPRPRKCRKVCCLPKNMTFVPADNPKNEPAVILTVDEYETIRLIDKEGFSQEECGVYMQVARTTVQQIYNSARAKLATVLVEGLPLKIEGGDYHLCDGREHVCHCGGCKRHRCSHETSI